MVTASLYFDGLVSLFRTLMHLYLLFLHSLLSHSLCVRTCIYKCISQRDADAEAAEEEVRETARAAQMIARKVADAAAGLSRSPLQCPSPSPTTQFFLSPLRSTVNLRILLPPLFPSHRLHLLHPRTLIVWWNISDAISYPCQISLLLFLTLPTTCPFLCLRHFISLSSSLSFSPFHRPLYLPFLSLLILVPPHRPPLTPVPLEKRKKSDLKALKMMGSGGAGAAGGAAALSMASSSAGTPSPSRPVRTDTDSVYVLTQTVCTCRARIRHLCYCLSA